MKKKKRIILGLTGSIAAIKIFELIEEFERNNFEIRLIASDASKLFILSALARRPWKIFKLLAVWETGISEVAGYFSMEKGNVRHINLIHWADAMVIAPATANTISKIACAIDDNRITTIALAMPSRKKIFFAPAMNTEMWNKSLFQENLQKLRRIPEIYSFIGPVYGTLQCGAEGMGKMEDVKKIVEQVKEELKLLTE